MAIPDLSNVISQINEDLLKEVDSNPSIGMDTTIKNPEKVFDNQSVFEKLDKIRQEISADSTGRTNAFGLNSGSKDVPTVNAEVVQQGTATQTTQSTQTGYGTGYTPYGYSPYGYNPYGQPQQPQTTTVKQKTRDERVAEYADKLVESIGKQVVDKVDKQFASVSKRKNNWTIFDMHEEKIKKKAKMTPKELKQENKKPLISDDSKISMYDTMVLVGRAALTTLLLGNKRGDK